MSLCRFSFALFCMLLGNFGSAVAAPDPVTTAAPKPDDIRIVRRECNRFKGEWESPLGTTKRCDDPKNFGMVDGGGAIEGTPYDLLCSAVAVELVSCIDEYKTRCENAGGTFSAGRPSQCMWDGSRHTGALGLPRAYCYIIASATQDSVCAITNRDYDYYYVRAISKPVTNK